MRRASVTGARVSGLSAYLWIGLAAAALSSASTAGCSSDDTGTAGNSGGAAAGGSGSGGGGSGGEATGGSGTGGSGTGGAATGGAGTGGAATGGAGTGGSGTGGASACPGLGDPCTTCLVSACEDVYCTCYAAPECGAISACVQSCAAGDASCIQSCFGSSQGGIAEYLLAVDCAATACGASCPGAGALDPCTKCAAAACAPELEECLADDECYDLILCLLDCPEGDDFCVQTCGFDNLGGTDEAQDLNDCAQGACGFECQ